MRVCMHVTTHFTPLSSVPLEHEIYTYMYECVQHLKCVIWLIATHVNESLARNSIEMVRLRLIDSLWTYIFFFSSSKWSWRYFWVTESCDNSQLATNREKKLQFWGAHVIRQFQCYMRHDAQITHIFPRTTDFFHCFKTKLLRREYRQHQQQLFCGCTE